MSAHRYEGPKDRTNPLFYIPLALLAVGIVAFVFASGVLQGLYKGRISERPDRPDPREAQREQVNVRALAEATPDLVRLGRQVYGLNCASCHGDQGDGRGASGRGLNPPPMNFQNPGEWTNSPSIAGMWKTLQEGIPGTSMVNYRNTLSAEQRIAVIHFIRDEWLEEIGQAPEVTEEDLAALPAPGATAAAGEEAFEEVDTGPSIPVRLAMRKMAEERPRVRAIEASLPERLHQMPGSALFGANCATCHGPSGEGMEAVRVLSVFPYIRVSTDPLIGSTADWVENRGAFRRIVTGADGSGAYHGFSTLSSRQLEELHDYVRALATEGTVREVAYEAR